MKDGQWRKLDKDTWIRNVPGQRGKIEAVLAEDMKESLELKHRLRTDTRRKPSATHAKGFHFKASYPKTVYMEMKAVCGDDPEKQRMFMRDHPEHWHDKKENMNLPTEKYKNLFTFPTNPLAKK